MHNTKENAQQGNKVDMLIKKIHIILTGTCLLFLVLGYFLFVNRNQIPSTVLESYQLFSRHYQVLASRFSKVTEDTSLPWAWLESCVGKNGEKIYAVVGFGGGSGEAKYYTQTGELFYSEILEDHSVILIREEEKDKVFDINQYKCTVLRESSLEDLR